MAPIIFLGGDLTVSLRSHVLAIITRRGRAALGMRDYSGPNPQFLSGSLRRLGLPAALFLGAAPPSRPENLRIANQVAMLEAAKAEFEASWKQWKAWAKMEEVP